MINPFDLWTFWITSIIVIFCAFLPYVRRVSEWFTTLIHEIGHAIFSVITGGGIHSIKLRANGSGETHTLSSLDLFTWFRRVIVLFAGYLTPIFFGLLLIWGVKNGYAQTMFYVLLGTAIVTLLFIRNFFGILIVTIYLGFLFLGVFVLGGIYLPTIIYGFGLLLFIRGYYDLIMVGRMVFKKRTGNESDFDFLADSTFISIPAPVWYVVYAILVVPTSLWFGLAIITSTSPVPVS